MKTDPHPPPNHSEPHDELPNVPGFRTWRGVYLFVFACFIAVVLALFLFSHYAAK